MTAEIIDNRRTQVRKPLRCPSQVVLPSSETIPGRALDVSIGGVCVILPKPLPAGATCQVKFTTPVDGTPYDFVLTGKVAYSVLAGMEGFRTGLEFSNLSRQSAEMLARLVNGALKPPIS